MRIRSIRPEFWTSEDIAALSWEHRLIYIGLWSYVDDNGVGRDVARLIAADLFPLETNTQRALQEIQGALTEYSSRKMITRYTVDGKPYLHVTSWPKHQKINRPSAGRYPLPTREDAVIYDPGTEGSVRLQAVAPLGEGEKGRRGEVQTSSSADADGVFDRFWAVYPKKVSKQDARKRWDVQIRKTKPDVIIEGARFYAKQVEGTEAAKIKNPDGWLNGQRWLDEPDRQPAYVNDGRPEGW